MVYKLRNDVEYEMTKYWLNRFMHQYDDMLSDRLPAMPQPDWVREMSKRALESMITDLKTQMQEYEKRPR